ncbi:AraC family transcriptional regulator [Blautia sp. HCP3S3_G3]|uniref:AraC family transcriptional regulator n=1 Tax=Blautia sp. HCP3S3_G3 TaxID=3438913 RepID=UPI003049EC23|nr:AraC family transcriptional regulator [Blautia sp.]
MLRTVGYTDSGNFRALDNLQKFVIDVSLVYCGWEQCDPGHRFGPNKRFTYVLHMVEGGKGVFEMNGQSYYLEKGDAFLIPAGREAWYEADHEDPWAYRWIGFEGIDAEVCCARAGFTLKNPVRKITCLNAAEWCIEGMMKNPQDLPENKVRRNGLLQILFGELIADYRKLCIERGELPPEYKTGSVYVERAVEYINENYSKHLTINELADMIGVNRSYLATNFKKCMGCSPQEYLINVRVEQAKSLLYKTNTQISEVASKVGYQDPLAFSKIFKRKTGYSPTEYKEAKSSVVFRKVKGEYIGVHL